MPNMLVEVKEKWNPARDFTTYLFNVARLAFQVSLSHLFKYLHVGAFVNFICLFIWLYSVIVNLRWANKSRQCDHRGHHRAMRWVQFEYSSIRQNFHPLVVEWWSNSKLCENKKNHNRFFKDLLGNFQMIIIKISYLSFQGTDWVKWWLIQFLMSCTFYSWVSLRHRHENMAMVTVIQPTIMYVFAFKLDMISIYEEVELEMRYEPNSFGFTVIKAVQSRKKQCYFKYSITMSYHSLKYEVEYKNCFALEDRSIEAAGGGSMFVRKNLPPTGKGRQFYFSYVLQKFCSPSPSRFCLSYSPLK